MGLLNEEFHSLEDLMVHQLKDVYDAETRIVPALEKMAEAATAGPLKESFEEHRLQTEGHISRLDQVFRMFNQEPARETCPAIKGLIAEGEDAISAKGDAKVRDAALIAAAQRVEHYEIAAYGTMRALARQLGRNDAAEVLQQTLDEEGQADERLSKIAESQVNPQAKVA